MCITILSGGLLGLFLIGFLTKRVDGLSAFIATLITFTSVISWLFFKSSYAMARFPVIGNNLPDDFMINVVSNTGIFFVSYVLCSGLDRRSKKDLRDLTIWTN